MESFSLEEFDKHVENLRSQLTFLTSALNATDRNAPDWAAGDLLALRNGTSRLQDDMCRFRSRIMEEEVATLKPSNKRLSIEGSQGSSLPPTDHSNAQSESSTAPELPPSADADPHATGPEPPIQEDGYEVQYMDISSLVNQRLHESRMRRLMDSPRTAQKRKHDVFVEDWTEDMEGSEDTKSEALSREQSPVKKLKAFGSFEQALKRKDGRMPGEGDEGVEVGRKKQRK
ncbi:hypothetical protein CC78DRAFT_564573 [Lojkania enalia]|uniref:Uncharacterized protein n=1 Tax=Lojkania enalia TaxID=147567 RepID=A0A9P4TQ35_9PLEO|nr:hypothetical protein CC78DRAFT_564573 [Didymosphaeria enalia]